ncbi:MAG: NAD(P)-dependent oxidoreductase [Chloroflexi bacterium]|nr:NAD(P)-dependent oxidoreductase [Chloroflexota bacterium]
MLTDDAAVRDVCLGTGGVVDALRPNAIVVDMSTVVPETSRALAAAVPGGRFVEAPVLARPQAIPKSPKPPPACWRKPRPPAEAARTSAPPSKSCAALRNGVSPWPCAGA